MITITRHVNETLEFKGAADFLRWLSKNPGCMRFYGLERLYLGSPERNGQYWFEHDTMIKLSKEDYAYICRVLSRYQSYCHHMREIDPEWVDGEKIYWMDNSIDVIQHSAKYPGQKRSVQTTAPHGDAC